MFFFLNCNYVYKVIVFNERDLSFYDYFQLIYNKNQNRNLHEQLMCKYFYFTFITKKTRGNILKYDLVN